LIGVYDGAAWRPIADRHAQGVGDQGRTRASGGGAGCRAGPSARHGPSTAPPGRGRRRCRVPVVARHGPGGPDGQPGAARLPSPGTTAGSAGRRRHDRCDMPG
jgi:hypothetical protein